jgi:uncharacterized Fe-S center protein
VKPDITLPLFVAGRDFAAEMADHLGTMGGRSIVVDATGLSSGTSSFAAELVSRVLVDGQANELIVVGAPDPFAQYLTDAAAADKVSSALQITRDFPVPAR